MINTIEELLDNIFYDWGFCPNPQIREDENEDCRSFNVNKTSIYKENNKFFMHYKMDKIEMSEEVYLQFSKIADKFKADPTFEKVLYGFHDLWLDGNHESNSEFQEFIKSLKGN